jgi:ABC-2 type transport system ATP-binding protein
MINVEQLVFDYPGVRALDGVSFRIAKGSITALVGPNGAGKTTLLRCMAALEQPFGGSITINSVDVLEHPRQCHRIIGYLSDFFGLYQRLTVRQCLHFVARAHGIDEPDCPAAIAEVCQRLNIEDRLNMKPGELSRGLRQRVAIAQAIIHKPHVLLLDEPASGLDPEARHELESLFLDLQRQGMTLLVSSHILAELDAYCSDMLLLRHGRIVEQVLIKAQPENQNFLIKLANPVANLPALLANQPGIKLLKIENDVKLLLEISAEPEQQHLALNALMRLNLPVCEFAAVANNLQDAYLQTIKQQANAH